MEPNRQGLNGSFNALTEKETPALEKKGVSVLKGSHGFVLWGAKNSNSNFSEKRASKLKKEAALIGQERKLASQINAD